MATFDEIKAVERLKEENKTLKKENAKLKREIDEIRVGKIPDDYNRNIEEKPVRNYKEQ